MCTFALNELTMNKKRETDTLDAFANALANPNFKLSPQSEVRLNRLKQIFCRWMENPMIRDIDMRNWIMDNFGVGRDVAYSDMNLVLRLFGSAPKAEKEFQRMRANRLVEKAAAAAIAGDDKQAKSLIKIAEVIVKINQLDQPDGEDYQWDQIIPKDESFSVDPEVIGIKKVPGIEEKAKKLLARYTSEIDNVDIQDAE